MLQLAQGRFTNSVSAGGYYSTVIALTPKEGTQAATLPAVIADSPLVYLFSPYLIYGSVILFFALFLGAIFIQLVARVLDGKRTISTLVVALVLASLPLTLKTALEVTTLQTLAGPDEVPRNIQIKQTSANIMMVTWETQAEKVGSVRYGPVPLEVKSSQVVIADLGKKTEKHTAVIEGLVSGVEYELEILSGKEWYSDQGQPVKFRLQ